MIMKLAIIIPYYDGEQYISRCLNSLNNYSHENIYLVDNSEIPPPENLNVNHIVSEKKKIGFGAAVNLGLKEVYKKDFSHVLILNQDAFFQSGHFQKLLNALEENKLEKFASPMIYTEDFSEIMPFIKYRYFNDFTPETPIDIDDFVAVGLIVPVKLMKKLGGFDKSFFMYYEDNDLIARSKIPKPVRVFPQIHLAHHNPDLDGKSNPEKDKWIQKSRQKYLWRHGSKIQWFVTATKNFLKGY